MAVLLPPVVFLKSARAPLAVLFEPVVFEARAPYPTAVSLCPLTLGCAPRPMAVFVMSPLVWMNSMPLL